MLWKKKTKPEPTQLKSDEYEELHGKISKILVQVHDLDNRVGLLDGIAKSNRARINHLKVDKVLAEEETYKKSDDVVYLGDGRMKP